MDIDSSMIEYPPYSPNFTLFSAISIHSSLYLTNLIDHYTCYSLIKFLTNHFYVINIALIINSNNDYLLHILFMHSFI